MHQEVVFLMSQKLNAAACLKIHHCTSTVLVGRQSQLFGSYHGRRIDIGGQ